MKLNRKTTKRIMLLITFIVLLYWGVNNISTIGKVIAGFFSLISPFVIGLCIAFVMNLILVPLERLWQRIWKNKKVNRQVIQTLKRPVCLVLSTLLLLSTICAVFFVLVPQLEKTGTNFVKMFPGYIKKLNAWWADLTALLSGHGIILPAVNLNLDTILNALSDFFEEKGSAVVDTTLNITISVVNVVVKVALGFVFALYLLAQKEHWTERAKWLLSTLLPENAAKKTMKILSLSNTSFTNFVTGQVFDALAIGFLCCIGMLIFRFPYALPISIIVCFTALIPILGAWIGAAIGAILIVFVSPVKAFWFLVFLIVLQMLEGNLIYPKIVGKSVGLPGLWVLVAVSIGGDLCGIIGMLLAVPLCSVIYALVQEYVKKKEIEKENA